MSIQDFLKEGFEAGKREFEVSDEDARVVDRQSRLKKDLAEEGPRWDQMTGAYRPGQAYKTAVGFPEDKIYKEVRERKGVGFDVSSAPKRIGTFGGALASDLISDSTRRIYWLLNALQATGDVISEKTLGAIRPDLYAVDTKKVRSYDSQGRAKSIYNEKSGRYDPSFEDKKTRRYSPVLVQALSAPAGFAINQGLGLMTPFGGYEGYKAALPSDEDPTKTSNPLLEIAAKYVLGRTGDLLPYNEFVKVRPDVSKEEYQRYKAFKFDKKTDLNPFDDGKVGLPFGVVKATTEGIHGPEVQFLGRSLPLTTGVVPFLGAVAGAGLGVSNIGPKTGDDIDTPNKFLRQFGSDKPVRRGAMGGVAGVIVGSVAGNMIENERRRRNTVENELDGTL